MDLISKEAIKKYISAPCTYVEGRRIFYEEDLDLMGSAFEGMTNGEVIQALFPNTPIDTRTYAIWVGHDDMSFTRAWWNAPYKAESEEV